METEELVSNCCGAETEIRKHYYDNNIHAWICTKCECPCLNIEKAIVEGRLAQQQGKDKEGLEQLINSIKELKKFTDTEVVHKEIDKLIVKFINDDELTNLFEKDSGWGWYA